MTNTPHSPGQRFKAGWQKIIQTVKGWTLAAWAAICSFFMLVVDKVAGLFGRKRPTQGRRAAGDAMALPVDRMTPESGPFDLAPPEDGDEMWEGRLPFFKPRQKPRNFILTVLMTTIKFFALFLVVGGFAVCGVVFGVAKAYLSSTPTLDISQIEEQSQTSFLYDVNGNLITTFAGIENRVWANYEEIPKVMLDAVVSIEDERFYSHNGVDYKRIVGAFFHNLTSSSTQGGSTITQQLIKMRILTPDQTYKRKLQEAYLAMQLEKEYSKEDILEAYLNTIHLGGSNYGVKAAAKDYFGLEDLSQMTIRQAAMLAGIAKSPYAYDPRRNFYGSGNPLNTQTRTNIVLKAMYENGYITKEEYDAALVEDVAVLEKSESQEMYDMPYFVEYAIYDVVTHMLRKGGLPDNDSNRSAMESKLRTGGYNIYLTVDPTLQKAAEEQVANWGSYPRMRDSKDAQSADGTIQPQCGSAVVDYHNGHLAVVIGGRETPTVKKAQNRAYQTHMPVGSSIKPIAVYAPALDKGASPATILYNVPARIPGWGTDKGYPSNYGGGGFSGPTTMRVGLRKSLNVVAAATLMQYVGVEDSYNYLVSMGVKSTINKDGPGLALGTSGITPIEMAGCFGTLANLGEYVEPVSFTRIEDNEGNLVLDVTETQVRRQVFKQTTSWMITDLLEDAVQNGTGSRANWSGMHVAGKTGTNSDYRGVFFAGYTPYYAGALWVGSDEYKPLYSGAQGGRDAAPLWRQIMKTIHDIQELPDKEILDVSAEDLGLVRGTVCSVSGKKPNGSCETVTDWFAPGTLPTTTCDMHITLTYCSDSNKLAGPYCPESSKVSRPAVVIGENTTLNGLSASQLSGYIPNAVSGIPDALTQETIQPGSEAYEKYYCDIHTKEWSDNQGQFQALLPQAQSLLSQASGLLAQLQDTDPGLASSLQSAITNLNNQMGGTDLAGLQSAYDALRGLVGSLSG